MSEEHIRDYVRRKLIIDGPRLGLFLVLVGLAAFSALFTTIFPFGGQVALSPNSFAGFVAAAVIILIVYAGARIAVTGATARQAVIPDSDRALLEPLIAEGNEKAIDQYVRLSSLSGGTGLATKLGLTGLPLLTVALTLIFSALELYKPTGGFLDLAKLSLGAFIGSFVQRVATTQSVTPSGRTPPVA
jgi:uncharacterized membrane protein YbhN (UPF0104 family)